VDATGGIKSRFSCLELFWGDYTWKQEKRPERALRALEEDHMAFKELVFTREILGLECEITVTFEGDTIREMTVTHKDVELEGLDNYGFISAFGKVISFEEQLTDDAWDEKASER
jgi:hypothetical protein